MSDGRIELERRIDSIVVGVRHRKDLGDIEELMRSIEQVGLLQPITITPDGVLVCGARRLEAMRRLGERTLKVWVRSGISDDLSRLLSQQDENALHKPLSPLEAESLFREVKQLLAEAGHIGPPGRRHPERPPLLLGGLGVVGVGVSLADDGVDPDLVAGAGPRRGRGTRTSSASRA